MEKNNGQQDLPLLVIGNKNYSSWSLRPWLLLRHFDVKFEEKRLILDTPDFEARISAYSPTRRVPVLHDGELVVWDSLAICEYINERWLDGQGWPRNLAARAQARAAASEMHSGFAALRTQLPMNCRRQPDAYHWDAQAQSDIDRVQQLWGVLRTHHGQDGDFLCGGFGIIDAMFAPVAMRFVGYGVSMNDIATAYVRALQALPAMAEWRDAAQAEIERNSYTDSLRA